MRKRIVFNNKIFEVDTAKDTVISMSGEANKRMFFTQVHPIRKRGKLIGGLLYEYTWFVNGNKEIISKEYIKV